MILELGTELGTARILTGSTQGRSFSYHFYALPEQETSAVPFEPDPRDLAIRGLCHLLIERIPAGGILEACENLAEVYTFHKARTNPPALAPSVEPIIPTAVMDSYERPRFSVSEE